MKESSLKITENEAKLLNELGKNCAQSNGKLANKLKIHHTTVVRMKRSLEEKLGFKCSICFNPQKIQTHRMYYILQQLVPGARNNPELDRKMEVYMSKRPHIVSYGKCIHGKWDSFAVFYCSESKFDEHFSEYKSMVNIITEEMDIIKVVQPLHPSYIHIPTEAVL